MLIQGDQESIVEMQKKLLFLHGMGGTGALWRPILVALEKDYEVLALDQMGTERMFYPIPARLIPHSITAVTLSPRWTQKIFIRPGLLGIPWG